MYLIKPEEELTLDRLRDILQKFQTLELPRLEKFKRYYDGKQEILNKKATDTGKPCNKIVTNFCHQIVKNFSGFLTGQPVTYAGDGLDEVLDIINYNDPKSEDTDLLQDALLYGIAYEINYIDEESQQRFKRVDPRSMIPVYNATLTQDLRYCIRFWREDSLAQLGEDHYYVEVYGNDDVTLYRSTPGFNSFELIETRPNFFSMCPVTVLEIEDSVFAQIITLQDSYNTIMSSSVDDIQSFADAYMVIKGMTADEEELAKMKECRVLVMDADASAEYLTKTVTDQQIQDILANIKDNIHKVSQCPDFQDPLFTADSGVALKYKLIGFLNAASVIENLFVKALQRRVELICSILNLTYEEQVWRDIDIRVNHNLPNTLEPADPSQLIQYRNFVSDETLLGLLPFVKDVDYEQKKVQEQTQASLEMYETFNNTSEDEEVEDEDE